MKQRTSAMRKSTFANQLAVAIEVGQGDGLRRWFKFAAHWSSSVASRSLLSTRKSHYLRAMRQRGIFRRVRSRFAAGFRWLADRTDAVDPEPCDPDCVEHFQVLSLPPKSTKPSETKEECTGSPSLTRSQSDWDDYVACFLDWCIERGHTGEHDTDEVLALTQSFDRFARTPRVHETPFFQALSRAGVEQEKIDMPRTDPRYAKRKAEGCKRPRLRIYNLPREIPDCCVPAADSEPLPLAA